MTPRYKEFIVDKRLLAAALALAALLAGCVPFDRGFCAPFCTAHVHNSSSLVGFLYPDGSAPPRDNSIPELPVPLRVGLAFLPSPAGAGLGTPTAARREELLERIRQRFASRKFVSEITVIPDYYRAGGKGMGGLEGVERLYNVDVMALVSYDQVGTSSEMKYRSLTYLTIIGAFIVNGSEHDVSTLVDLAVIEPRTRSLILRAGGTDSTHGTSTLVDQPKEIRLAAADGFTRATDSMIDHFDVALSRFESDVRSGTARVKVVNKDGSPRGGAGAFGVLDALLLLPLLALRAFRTRRRLTGAQ